MRVLVTGHEGYVGSVLTPLLTAAGHDVVGLDAGFFSQTSLGPPAPAVPSLRLDVRDVTTEHVRGFDAVIHLAGLSNDPLGDLEAATTLEINYEATIRLATLAKRAGVERFLFASSCSLYGAALPDDVLDESAEFRPVTPYGRSKMLAERDLQPLADERFTPVYLRAATVYGYSPRLRADLVLNNLVGHAVLQGAVLLKSDGTPWRPLVHVADLAQAYLALLTAPRQVVCNRAFNVGRSAENYQMLDVARIVAEQLPGVRVSFADGAGPDVRCYRVTCERLQSECPEYRPSWNVALGAVELAEAYRRYVLTMTQFNGPAFQRLQRIKELQQSKVLDARLRPKRCNGHTTKTVTWSSATTCRACGGGDLEQVIRFAKLPLADVLLNDDGRADNEPLVPATVVRCLCCQLVQLSETVSRHALFNADYPYFSSASTGWVEHNRRNAEELIAQRNLNGNAVVIEAACNDGYMLRHFAARGIRTLGVDPAAGPVATARALGLDVREAFFDEALARRLRDEGACADLFLANNVLAHVDDLPGFVRGIAAILRPQGQAVIEVPYLGNLIEQGEFDTIYHQHLCYFSVTALQSLFAAAGLRLAEIRRLPTHGGSLRLYVDRTSGEQSPANAWIEAERNRGMHTAAYYAAFRDRVENTCRTLREKMSELRRQGLRIAAYGAAAKGTTLLAAAEIPAEWIEYVVDRNPHKHGRYLPGVRRPIVGLEVLERQPPDVLLLLPWNLADEILEQQADFRRRGGRFLIPVPDVRLV